MHSKKASLLLLTLVFSFSAFSQVNLREYIAIVRPVYAEKSKNFLNLFNDETLVSGIIVEDEDKEKNPLSEDKLYSSGFFVKAPNGKVYLLTNKYVTGNASSIKAELVDAGGGTKILEGGQVLFIDEEEDIALVEFPEGMGTERYFEPETIHPEDGASVYAAGYPVLAGKPVWQFSKGIVSNSAFSMSVFDEELKAKVIQHTAHIDVGSAGSPLLIPDKTKAAGYALAGINTWKVFNRENVNLAVPVSSILKFLELLNDSSLVPNQANLEKKARQFSTDVADYKKIMPYLAVDYIAGLTREQFYMLYDRNDSQIKSKINDALIEGETFTATRYVLANEIYKLSGSGTPELNFLSVTMNPANNNEATTVFLLKDQEVIITWIKEQNSWKISNFSALNLEVMEKKVRKTSHMDYVMALDIHKTFPFTINEKGGFGADLDVMVPFIDNVYVGVSFNTCAHLTYKLERNYDTAEYFPTDTSFINYHELYINAGYQYPLRISNLFVIPYITGSFGFLSGNLSALVLKASAGIKAAYPISKHSYLMLKAGLTSRNVKEDHMFYFDVSYDTKLGGLGKFAVMNVGLTYAVDLAAFLPNYKSSILNRTLL